MADRDSYQQHEHRDPQTYADQHGRAWAVILDGKSFAPCVPPSPAGWSAPILPPLARVGIVRKPDGKPVLGKLLIDYDGWLADLTLGHRQFAQWKAQAAQAMYGQGAAAALAAPPAEFLDYLGTPPQPPELVRLARAGVRWVLGLPLPGQTTPAPIPVAAAPLLDQLRRAEQQSLAVVDTPADEAALLAQFGDVDAEPAPETPVRLDAEDAAAMAAFGDAADDGDPDGLHAVAAAAKPRTGGRR